MLCGMKRLRGGRKNEFLIDIKLYMNNAINYRKS